MEPNISQSGLPVKAHRLSWVLIFGLVIVTASLVFLQYSAGKRPPAQVAVAMPTPTPSQVAVAMPTPTPDLVQSFAAYGDTRTGNDIHRAVIASMAKHDFLAVMHVGDLVEDGNKADQWVTFNQITAGIKDKLLPVLGNHENNSQNYFDNFTLPGNERWYKKDYATATIIALDSTSLLTPGSEQYEWLESVLIRSDKSKFTIVFFHHPPFSTGEHKEDELGLRKSIVPLFEKYGVDLVLNGHDHDYERSLYDGTYYIVVGSGGAPLRSQARTSPYSQKFLSTYNFSILKIGKTIDFKAYNKDDTVIDSVVIQNRL